MTESAPLPQRKLPRAWLYPLLLAFETAGAVLLFSEGLPIYRKTLADPGSFDHKTTGIALGGAMLIQIAYWTRYRIRAHPPWAANVVIAHIVLFLGRLVFTLPTAIFSYLFVAKAVVVQIPATKYAFIIFALFSLFCYVRELENLGAALASTSPLGRAS